MDGRERAAAAHATGGAVARVTRAVAGTHEALTDTVRTGLTPLGPVGRLPFEASALMARFNFAAVETVARGVGAVAAPVLEASAAPDAQAGLRAPAGRGLVGRARRCVRRPVGRRPSRACPGGADVRCVTVARSSRSIPDPAGGDHPRPHLHGRGVRARAGQPRVDVGAVVPRRRPRPRRHPADRALHDRSGHRRLRCRARRPARPARRRLAGGRRADRAGRPLDGRTGHPRGARRRPPWRRLVSDVITLGTPHSGAPLERAAVRGLALASSLPVTAPLAALGDERSTGIKDLGIADVAPATAGPDWHLVAASLRPRDAVGIVGRARSGLLGPLGDGMVSVESAFAVEEHLTARRLVIDDAEPHGPAGPSRGGRRPAGGPGCRVSRRR